MSAWIEENSKYFLAKKIGRKDGSVGGKSMQLELQLPIGWHVGPLFIIRKRWGLVRPHGKQGVVHRAQTVRATPPWADMRAIAAFYKEARRLTKLTGELYVVDHIVPKCSPLVCGLHVPANLRVIHWRDNARKGATWWPDMPFAQLELL